MYMCKRKCVSIYIYIYIYVFSCVIHTYIYVYAYICFLKQITYTYPCTPKETNHPFHMKCTWSPSQNRNFYLKPPTDPNIP